MVTTKRAKAPVELTEVAVEATPTQANAEYRAWAEKLKVSNPAAYQKNEAQILAKLNQL